MGVDEKLKHTIFLEHRHNCEDYHDIQHHTDRDKQSILIGTCGV